MATFTVNFQAPTTYIPANFTLDITPAEAEQILAEMAPLIAGNITIGNFAAGFPNTAKIVAALQGGITQTATAAVGAAAQPVISTITL